VNPGSDSAATAKKTIKCFMHVSPCVVEREVRLISLALGPARS
jgi:hypothetical protein